MIEFNPLSLCDFYKTDHRRQYPEGTTLVYNNFTPRTSRVPGVNHMVLFGLQYAIKEYFIDRFNKYFFQQPKDKVVGEYQQLMDYTLGPGSINCDHIGELHDLGYLPMLIKALPEGTKVPMGVPALTTVNTHPDFYWLTNYLETILSALLWKPCTSATTAGQFYDNFMHYARRTSDEIGFVPFQGHDFSFRGMSMLEDACVSGAAHLLYFDGTDTVPAIPFLEKYYGADKAKELIGTSVPATEHSVMSAGGDENEFDTYKRLLTKVYPHGIVSIVSDTYDFWNVVTDFIPRLKQDIINRGVNSPSPFNKFVVRPDSGDPVKIICGDPDADSEPERKGLVQCLWDTFGGTVNSKGYKQLHPSIGYIYGDSINIERQLGILGGLEKLGFSSTNGVLGIGSYTYQYVTRDTYGTVCKATYCEVNGKPREIFKTPKTGGWKKSHRGLLRVNEDLTCSQQVTKAEEKEGLLVPVFKNGKLLKEYSLAEIRAKVRS